MILKRAAAIALAAALTIPAALAAWTEPFRPTSVPMEFLAVRNSNLDSSGNWGSTPSDEIEGWLAPWNTNIPDGHIVVTSLDGWIVYDVRNLTIDRTGMLVGEIPVVAGITGKSGWTVIRTSGPAKGKARARFKAQVAATTGFYTGNFANKTTTADGVSFQFSGKARSLVARANDLDDTAYDTTGSIKSRTAGSEKGYGRMNDLFHDPRVLDADTWTVRGNKGTSFDGVFTNEFGEMGPARIDFNEKKRTFRFTGKAADISVRSQGTYLTENPPTDDPEQPAPVNLTVQQYQYTSPVITVIRHTN